MSINSGNMFQVSEVVQGPEIDKQAEATGSISNLLIVGQESLFFPWKILYPKFSLFLEGRALSERTKRDYRSHIHRFFGRFPSAAKSWRSLQESIYKHLAGDIKPSTYNLRRQYLLSFFKWCVEEGYLSKNPLQGIKKKQGVHRDIVIEESRIAALLKVIDIRTFAGARDMALIMFTMDTGIRPGEATQLLPGDILKSEKTVQVRKEISKCRKTRRMPFSDHTLQAIKYFETQRNALGISNTVPFFCTIRGKGFGEFGWASRMKKYSEKSGYTLAPYDLRHYFAVLYLRNGGREEPLRRILGHEDERTLKWYMALANTDIIADHAKASPVQNLFAA